MLWTLVAFLPLLAVGVGAPFTDDDREFASYAIVPLGMGALVRLPQPRAAA